MASAEVAEQFRGPTGGEDIPDQVKDFLVYFYQCFQDGNTYELHGCYENTFNKLTDKYYKNSPWPEPVSEVGPLVDNDPVFLVLYTEVYYRHIYSHLQPTLDQRVASYTNYCDLFNLILNSADGPVGFELPHKWIWDIIDEFIYQFNQFIIYRSKLVRNNKDQNSSEIAYLRAHSDIWNSYSVLNALYSLIGKSNIYEQLKAASEGGDVQEVAGEYGNKPLYKNMGYFSIIGLLRVHTLLGDFVLALKTLEGIELKKYAFYTKVPSAHFTIYYYVGFCYLMMHRYADAIKMFSHILLYISRTKNIARSGQYDIVTKKSEQMKALLAISVSLCPTRVDDVLHSAIREKYGEQLSKMQRGGAEALPVYEELLKFSAPKFISTALPDYEHPKLNTEPSQLHLKVFMIKIKNSVMGPTLKGYMNLYASIELQKLAGFLETDAETLRQSLIAFKNKNRQLKTTGSRKLLEGEVSNVYELDIKLENDIVYVKELKQSRKFADWFIRNTIKNVYVQDTIENPEKQEDKFEGRRQKRDRKDKK